ncbi:4'-phosphopantetheinyl transferase family protein [Paracoccus aminophilus]|uniref:Enterobactin synthase component D n=1 Tax=Paracoccus aminophilus JCM 7686 TaxID=1367847 RepID=S5YCM4_PARAH|nr:4'-phosphopantetheinyl transferase superfamily protein [Paracoccus aminophilus]AGT09193.1 phosphopantetheinyl transferase [Paracoccus aminophilus JCM 7686]
MRSLESQLTAAPPVTRAFLEELPGKSLLGPSVSSALVRYDVGAFSEAMASALDLPLPSVLRQTAVSRKSDYTAGRYCARVAMSRFSDEAGRPYAVPPGPAEAAPHWPRGLVGSISHARGRAVSLIASASQFRSIGVDIDRVMEPEQARKIEAEICPTELHALPRVPAIRALHVTAIFSAKESLFKCLYPLVNQMFWFDAASVVISRDLSGNLLGFRATLTCDLPPFSKGWTVRGRLRCEEGYVLSAIALP